MRTWGNHRDGSTVLLTGTYQPDVRVSRRLLAAVARLSRSLGGEWDTTRSSDIWRPRSRDLPGQQVVLDRLLDLLLVSGPPALDAPAPARPARTGSAAQGDPVVGPALRLLHERPGMPWTLAGLASAVGVSRSGLARRFTALVGEPPMGYLTTWRLTLAADLLREPGATVGAVARQVGYGSAYALSTAFKRERGITPREHRRAG